MADLITQGKVVIGIWDGHDSGVAVTQGDRVLFAANEERFSRRKLEVGFPRRSLRCAQEYLGFSASDVSEIVYSTSDFAKTITRVAPQLKEEYYLLRRRKKSPSMFSEWKKLAKYKLTELPSYGFTRWLSSWALRSELSALGFRDAPLRLVDHHRAHAAAAASCSGFDNCLVVTLDGIGDGLSGSLWRFDSSGLELLSSISGAASLGIFFEHVTNLLNMRELEDEGKVMALANFAFPIPDEHNPMLGFFKVRGTTLQAKYSSLRCYRELRKILWKYPSEQFAGLAQRTLEVRVCELIQNAVRSYGLRNVAYGGGVASNVKVNMLVRELAEVDNLYVFPHMGDGGLALGAALGAGMHKVQLEDCFLGPDYPEIDLDTLQQSFPSLKFSACPDPAGRAAELIADNQIVMWFQRRMEFGPRSLGARSILASASDPTVKDTLNLLLKKRVWYQPFCPSMLVSDAHELLDHYDGKQYPFMTIAFRVKEHMRHRIPAVINVDGSCRPQILSDQGEAGNDSLLRVLLEMKRRTGFGVLLNTSLNFHGEPVVCRPEEALSAFHEAPVSRLLLGPFEISK